MKFLNVSRRIITILPIGLTRGSGHLRRMAAWCVFCPIITVNGFFCQVLFVYLAPLLLCYVTLAFANCYVDWWAVAPVDNVVPLLLCYVMLGFANRYTD